MAVHILTRPCAGHAQPGPDVVADEDGFAWPTWTRDGTRIQLQHGSATVRVRVSDGRITPVASLEDIRQVILEGGESWMGVGAEYAPLVLREVMPPPEIYALEFEVVTDAK